MNRTIDRRDFIRRSVLAMGALPLLGQLGSSACSDSASAFPLNLFFTSKEVPLLRKRTELPMFKEYWAEVLAADIAADRKFLLQELQLNNHIHHIARAYQILEREAFVYLLTEEPERGELAHMAVQKLLQFRKWDYHMEAGKDIIGLQRAPGSLIAMSLAYDWLGDLLSKDEREEMVRQMADKGCEPCYNALYGMRYPDRVVGWGYDPESSFFTVRDMRRWPIILDRTNLKMVPVGALAVGTAALLGKDDRTARWLEMVTHSYKQFVKLFFPDGSYDEGSGYWSYTASHMALCVEVLKRKKLAELFDDANYAGMMRFMLALQMPHEGHDPYCVNFGDSGTSFDSGIGFWIASRSRDGLSQYVAEKFARSHNHFSLIWYDNTVNPEPPKAQRQLHHLDLDWVISRTGFEKDDLVVAMRSGKPSNHENADRNSVLLKAYSEVLLNDVKHPPYDHQHPAWMLRTSPAHNCVLIDGQGHQYHDGMEGTNPSKAEAKILRTDDQGTFHYWASDATQAYALVNPDVESVTRSVIVLLDLPAVVVVDKLIKKHDRSLFSARWHIENQDSEGGAKIDGRRFVIQRPLARFAGMVAGSENLQVELQTLPIPVGEGVYPFVEIGTKKKAKSALLLMAGCPLRSDEKIPEINIEKKGDYWRIRISRQGRSAEVKIFDRGAVPEYEVV
ncbi:MAG TPA: heparinase II/III family protein [bacterium]|nr:heparinase II/III family protein [bacterium]HOX85083.1 heparinase II/III family protein [bacterium]HPG44052.1 heparinase II/III family protein [bacterium]HPM96419.1 heparinase II/III family protein [bacterium]